MIRHSRRRVRPRFFVFLSLVIAMGAALFVMASRPSPPVRSPVAALPKKPRVSHELHCRTVQASFSLPQSLSNLRALTIGSSLIVAGLVPGSRNFQGVSVSITSQGLVQGPSPILFPGGNLVLSQNMEWWAGGVHGQTIQRSALNLQSDHSYANFLPTPLNRAAVALSPTGSELFMLGGSSQNALSNRIYQLTESSGSFHFWGTLPQAVDSPAAATGGNFLVVAGGTLAGGRFSSDVWIYQLSSRNLLTTLHLPYGIQGAQIIYTQHRFWLLGGEKSPGHLLSSIWLVTPARLIKTPVHLPVPLADFGAGVLNHRIWIVGGTTNHGLTSAIRTLTLKVDTIRSKNVK
ncbi:MAG: hypothetical protein M1493_16975 [Firmicutes bacterium]|nr:hypothetical protein [Bacillota bacterium]